MRKIFFALIFLALSFFAWVYFFIPPSINIEESVLIKANKNTVNRGLNNPAKWKVWWPATVNITLNYHNITYKPQLPGLYAFVINIKDDEAGNDLKTMLTIVEKSNDSIMLTWKGLLATGSNPFTRANKYAVAKKLAGNMKDILNAAQKFMSDHQNVYGIKVTHETVKDTLLLNTQTLITHTPSTGDIYALINKLTKAANDAKAPVTGYPMMNITKKDSSNYLLRVALPVSKPVKEENGIVIKRMIPGNILVSNDVTGGPASVEEAFKQMLNYAQDINKTLPAIPFQSLITNRQTEKDSSKWITRIYCPVI